MASPTPMLRAKLVGTLMSRTCSSPASAPTKTTSMPLSSSSASRSIAASDVPAQRAVPIPVRNDGRPLLPEHSSVKVSSRRGLVLMSLRRNRPGFLTTPVISSEQGWSLEITGVVRKPGRFRLSDIRTRPRRELTFTLECSGNNGRPSFLTGIGTARWAGTSLAAMLREAELLDSGIEVVFVGADAGEEQVRDIKVPTSFARSMGVGDAMGPDNLLCYEMNGAPLPPGHGFPLRLIAPGWYGIANVKWLTRIEVRATRLENRFMGRDYVTIREEKHDKRTEWVETSVGRAEIKSAPARVVREDGRYKIVGMAWGTPIASVEVSIDSGPWQIATIDPTHEEKYAWRPWSLEWPSPAPGEHAITARATGADGSVQPAPTDHRLQASTPTGKATDRSPDTSACPDSAATERVFCKEGSKP